MDFPHQWQALGHHGLLLAKFNNLRAGGFHMLKQRPSGQRANESNSGQDAQPCGKLFQEFDDDCSPKLTQAQICGAVTICHSKGPISCKSIRLEKEILVQVPEVAMKVDASRQRQAGIGRSSGASAGRVDREFFTAPHFTSNVGS